MTHEKKAFMHLVHAKTGGGGWFCYCCTPGRRNKKRVYRSYKKTERRIFEKFVLDVAEKMEG